MDLNKVLDIIGVARYEISYREKLISIVGGFIGILAIFVTSEWLLTPATTVLIVPSMGATAVLLFAAPHAAFSQPWNVVGGHAISAIIGVACWKWIPDMTVAASVSVALSIGIMYYARCIHPPGGATALAAVIGPQELHALGFTYEYEPVLLNVAVMLLVAVAFNSLFKWRRYPAYLQIAPKTALSKEGHYEPIKHEDFVYALSHIDTFVDITEEDLLEIYRVATTREEAKVLLRINMK